MADGGIYVWEPAVGTAAGGLDHPAVGAIMVFDPTHPDLPGWRPLCGVALVHPRVAQTAGHCVQVLRDGLAVGEVEAAWVSFQADPTAHFDADPAQVDPSVGGWLAIGSVHVNHDNLDFVSLLQADTASVHSVWGTFHDTGAIVLARAVDGITPLRMASEAGEVERLLRRVGCATGAAACRLVEIGPGGGRSLTDSAARTGPRRLSRGRRSAPSGSTARRARSAPERLR